MTIFNRNTSSSRFTSYSLLKRYVRIVLWLYSPLREDQFLILLNKIIKLHKTTGWLYTVQYLKHCSVYFQHYVSGRGKVIMDTGDIRVGVRDNGLPIIIPGVLRQLILSKDLSAIRSVYAILLVYRVISLRGIPKFKTIYAPFSGLSTRLQQGRIEFVFDKYIKPISGKPFKGQSILLNMKTAGPNTRPSILGAPLDAYAIWVYGSRLLYPMQVLSAYFESDIFRLLKAEIEIVKKWKVDKQLNLGKLATKVEAAGKVRVFAIVDVWSQSLLEPIHAHVFNILKNIPNDGCFDQEAPLKRLLDKRPKETYSFDLSAATDRFPIDVQVQVLSLLYNKEVAEAWKSLLVDRPYFIGFNTLKNFYKSKDLLEFDKAWYNNLGVNLHYSVGQPMGALSSWGVFSLTHHIVVQYAARQVGFVNWFDDYALLGDDIVIANKEVADAYLYTMVEILGVEINLSKSLISKSGVVEFAKRLCDADVNYTPVGAKNIGISIKNFANVPSLLRDFVSKGGYVDNASLQRLMSTLSYDVTRTSKKNLTSLIWVIMGPFGFINTGENRFGAALQSGTTLSPYDMGLRSLSYTLDWLIIPIKEVIREDYEIAWNKAVERTSKTLKAYQALTSVKGFVNIPASVKPEDMLVVPYGSVPDRRFLSSYRNMIWLSQMNYLDLLSQTVDTLSLNWPYSLSFIEGFRSVLRNVKFPSGEDNFLMKPRVQTPRPRQTNINFFKRVRLHLVNMITEHHKIDTES